MLYQLGADLVAAAHLLFVGYVVLGGFLAWWWPRTLWIHGACAAWGLGSVIVGYECPLTAAEDWLRRSAGVDGLPAEGFIDHYLTGVIYPRDALPALQLAAAVCVVLSWAGCAVRQYRGSRSGVFRRFDA